MSKIESLLDEGTIKKLAAITAGVKADEPAYVVIKAATDPNPPRTLTGADAIDIDPESEAMIDALCVDCQVPMLIDPKLPEGEDDERPRVPICTDCATIRARFAALSERRNVEVIRRTRVAKHNPRTTDGIDHPVIVTEAHTEATPMKEKDLFDYENLSDAELGAIVRADLKAQVAVTVPAKREKAKAKKRKDDAAKVADVKARQQERKGHVLAAFKVGNFEVPALDLSDIVDFNEEPSATQRSPYNSARFRLAGEPALWAPSKSDEEGYVPTTYQTLIDEHARLMALALVKAAEKAEPKKKAAPKGRAPKITALLDPSEEAVIAKKVKALRKITGLDKETARAIVLAG